MELTIHYKYPVYPDLTVPNGFLPNHKAAQACWYYYLIANIMREKVGSGPSTQIILEGELWLDLHYENQARSVARMYGLESPAEMFKFWGEVDRQALELGLPKPTPAIMRAKQYPGLIV